GDRVFRAAWERSLKGHLPKLQLCHKAIKTEKAFTLIGKKLEKEYKKLGFKYSRKNKFLKKSTKKFDYYIFFSLFFENIPGEYLELHVTLMIADRALLKTNKYLNCEVFRMNLWEMDNHYNIANEALINDTFIDLNNKINEYLIPHIKRLEI
ncbi:MAG: hypothetical protein LBH15_04400, partial [Treponema sp.]|nr:hypothetical protein [Treponema sp.]